jgi:hypothetical protein
LTMLRPANKSLQALPARYINSPTRALLCVCVCVNNPTRALSGVIILLCPATTMSEVCKVFGDRERAFQR